MTYAAARQDQYAAAGLPAAIADDAYVLPARITAGHHSRGPCFGDDTWDLRPFLPRTEHHTRVDFTTLADQVAVTTVKEYLHSRLLRAVPVSHLSTQSTAPMKLTSLVGEFNALRFILASLASAGAPRLSEATQQHLDAVVAGCNDRPGWAKALVRLIKHLAGHGPFLSLDRLQFHPWPGRTDSAIAAVTRAQENSTDRIPEHIAGPLIKAAVFYVETASRDILTARAEIAALRAAQANRGRRFMGHRGAKQALDTFIAA
ncbi:MAG: hypothetical protein ACYDB7_11990, partial [Mycobacteriales bacterium]